MSRREKLSKPSPAGSAESVWIYLALLAVIAGAALFRSAYTASDLWPSPDAVEYALGAHRLASQGEYAIVVQGQHLPSRYPPWFSAFVLAPAYLLLGPEIGNAIYPVFLFGVAGPLLAFFLGKQVGQTKAGILAALAVLALPTYRMWGGLVMTDVPNAVLALALCLLYVRARGSAEKSSGRFLVAGILIAIVSLFRPASSATALPFLLTLFCIPGARQKLAAAACLIAPLCVAVIMTLGYNAVTFGSATRNGYQFWCPVPYDYFSLTFSISYVTSNLQALALSKLPLLFAGTGAVLLISYRLGRNRTAPKEWRAMRSILEFLLLGTGPTVVLHLIYFYPDPRFFLPTVCLSAILVAATAGSWLPAIPRIVRVGILICVLGLVLIWRHATPTPPPHQRIVAERIKRHTPDRAWVISAIDPVYLEYLISDDATRRVIPVSRRVEYASKLVAARKIPNPVPPPRSWRDHRCLGLINGGAREAAPEVASENLPGLRTALKQGVPIFVDTSFITAEDADALARSRLFRFVLRTDHLYELEAMDDP